MFEFFRFYKKASKPKVLMITWEFPPRITGGLSMACYGMVKSLIKRGFEILLLMPTKDKVYFRLKEPGDEDILPAFTQEGKRKENVNLGEFVSAYFRYDKAEYLDDEIKNILSLIKDGGIVSEVRDWTLTAVEIAQNLDFDIIHAHDWLCYPAGMILKKLGKPFIAHIHSTEFDRSGGRGGNHIIHKIEALGLSMADLVIAVSNFTAEEIKRRYGIPQNKVRVSHNAFLMRKGRERKRIFREPTVVFVGRITLQKGPEYFLEVAKKVLEKEKKVKFIMAGRGDMEREIMEKAASLDLGTNFIFAGFLSREEVDELFSSSDIFVMTSVSEPFGIVALEAMSRGAIAIIPKNSGVAEITQETIKVDFWDTDKIAEIILDLIKNPDKMKEKSERSIKEVERINWDNQVEKLIEIYSEVF